MIFGFIKKYFFTTMTFFNFNLSNVNSLECVSMNNQKCKMSRTNETRHIKLHKTCKCKCRLDALVLLTINKDGMKTNADVNVKN